MDSIANLDTDIASRMLSALIMEPDSAIETAMATVPIEEQKRYLKRHIDTITVEDRKSIGNILVMNNKRNLLHACAEGTVINLDSIPAGVIEQMYNLMMYKMNKRL